jgi:hypothetical protein
MGRRRKKNPCHQLGALRKRPAWAWSKNLRASHLLQVAGERGPLGISEPWVWRTTPEGGAFSEQRGVALRRSSERAAISSGKHGPSLRSIGLLASRARLILQRRHGVIRVKSPPWSSVARRALTGHLQKMGRSQYFLDLEPGEKRFVRYSVTFKRRKMVPELNAEKKREPL